MVSSRAALINKEPTSKDAINKPASCSQIVFANSKESFKVNSLEVNFTFSRNGSVSVQKSNLAKKVLSIFISLILVNIVGIL